MNTSSHCACRTAALRIFVRSLVGPVSTTLSTKAATSRAPTTAARQWRSLTTTIRPAVSRFQSTTATRAFHVSRRLLNNAQTVEKVEQVDATSITSEGPALSDTRSTVQETTIETEVAPTSSAPPPTEIVQPLQAVVYEAETEQTRTASTPTQTKSQPAATQATTPGKNMKKRLRRQQEAERLAAEAAAAVAAAAEGKADLAEAERLVKKLKPKKEKKEKPEKKNKLELLMESRDAKKKAKKDKRRERRAAEKAAVAAAASGAKTAPSTDTSKGDKPKGDKSKAKADTSSTSAAAAAAKAKAKPLPENAEPWQIQKHALREKFPEGWNPRKKLSPDALEGIRALNRQFPQVYTTAALAGHFQVSPEAIRRILKSKWQSKPEEEEDRQERWFQRGKQVWSRWAELGRKPPKRWQAEGILREPESWSGGRQRMMGELTGRALQRQKQQEYVSRQKQIMRQMRQNRENFQASLAAKEPPVSDNYSIPTAEAMQKAIEGSADIEAPERSKPVEKYVKKPVELTPEQTGTLLKATRIPSKGRAVRLRRSGKVDKKAAEEEESF
ncbi:Required for respiratory growth protein 9 mitochondrial [Sporothrix stenoceras]|uniref:Required for respiratory growth protein 9, mitochondrial n=1 Tax=Sporothrix stenoceras TaxID=5173 RepID=A0ABR3ZMD3_9PEZI